jgi:hypothetical protein
MSWELVSICTRSVDSFGLLFDLVILPTGALLFIFEVGFTNIYIFYFIFPMNYLVLMKTITRN